MPCEVQNLSNLVEFHSPRGQALVQLQVLSTWKFQSSTILARVYLSPKSFRILSLDEIVFP